ncbi:hypothetical protein [Hymenobacter properus]|uniref:Uncharacterized protein n=1 Tax=Hymenobacter properus TaxID=2791026 RepID=A0A931BMD3_9BACT|nr:hypothetical protein [Hymenobacter properus]MBF9144082.1 hypothetical protein [Hymenobacter properus]MBR7722898.1 hypothetical protein [Microvirga sp. SRT04]
MKPAPKSVRQFPPADPDIVRKVRRDHVAYAFFESLPGEQDHDYLPRALPQPQRLAEFGRPGL